MRLKKLIRPLKVGLGSDRSYLEKRYQKVFGFKPDLDNPKRFTEIMNWIKLNVRNSLYTSCADKHAVREFVKNSIGQEALIPLLAYGKCWDEIDFASLTEPFIIKTTHSSGNVVIVRDKSKMNENDIRAQISTELNTNYYHGLREWHYKNIPPAIVVEELLLDEEGRVPMDLKLHCFNYGETIETILEPMINRFSDTRAAFYTESWERLPFEFTYPQPESDLPCPDNLSDLCQTARILARPFKYVRVDLYSLNGRIYFGELTFTPNSGLKPFKPDEWDFYLGDKIRATGMLSREDV